MGNGIGVPAGFTMMHLSAFCYLFVSSISPFPVPRLGIGWKSKYPGRILGRHLVVLLGRQLCMDG